MTSSSTSLRPSPASTSNTCPSSCPFFSPSSSASPPSSSCTPSLKETWPPSLPAYSCSCCPTTLPSSATGSWCPCPSASPPFPCYPTPSSSPSTPGPTPL